MKKFKVIEEGRINNEQMSQISGGDIWICIGRTDNTYLNTCATDKVTCPIRYKNCDDMGNKRTCTLNPSGYKGYPYTSLDDEM